MKKTMLVSGLVLFSTLLGAVSANAADVHVVKSEGTIQFVTDNEGNEIIDPEDPGQGVTPGLPGEPEELPEHNNGPLSIDFVSSFKFGKQTIKATDATYFAAPQNVTIGEGEEAEAKKVPNYVQVTDKRGETSSWSLSVMQNEQFKAGENELTGASLKIEQAGTNSVMDEKYAPVLADTSFELKPGSEKEIISLKENTGMGQWAIYFGEKKTEGAQDSLLDLDGTKGVSLFVPASAVKLKDAQYSSELTWTLRDSVPNTEVPGE